MCKYCHRNAGYILETSHGRPGYRYGSYCKACRSFIVSPITKACVLYVDVLTRLGPETVIKASPESIARAAIVELYV